jgi:hypothetical protein
LKLAELLNERKTIKEEIKNVKQRLYLTAKLQEGDSEPVEPPSELKETLIKLHDRLNELIILINRTNVNTLEGGKSLMELIAERDKNKSIAEILHQLSENATPRPERFSKNEIRFIPSVDIKEIRQEADAYARRAREIDNLIQATNWNTEI